MQNNCKLYGILSYLAEKEIIEAPSDKYPYEVLYLLYAIKELCLWTKNKEESIEFGKVRAEIAMAELEMDYPKYYRDIKQNGKIQDMYNKEMLGAARLRDRDMWSQLDITEMRSEVENAIIAKLEDKSDSLEIQKGL